MIKWKPTTKERFWEMLEVLFPAAATDSFRAFQVGEPYDSKDGQHTFRAFKQVFGDYYESEEAVTFAEFKAEFPSAFYNYTS